MNMIRTIGVILMLHLFSLSAATVAQIVESEEDLSRNDQQTIKRIVSDCFLQMHDGWSSDEVILQDDLNQKFVALCMESLNQAELDAPGQNITDSKLLWTLINLRKAGKLKARTTRRKKIELSQARHIAEIVTRSLMDRYQCSIDRIMCDTKIRTEFDAAALAIDKTIDSYAVKKAAFQLRKARQLRPELITRIADWGRDIQTFSVDEIREDTSILNEHPGIYIFRDATGYLYIGQTDNLRSRLTTHLDASHNRSLASYLESTSPETITIEVHDFDPKSQATKTMVRRAYESELIDSRKPKFNVQP